MSDSVLNSEKIQRTLDIARTEINRQKPDRAIELVRELGLEEGQFGFERLYAEQLLVLAEAFAAKESPGAESLFDEALNSIASLPEPNEPLEMRAKEHFAMYLARFRASPSKALKFFGEANRIAARLELQEDSARIQLGIERIELEIDKSPELQNFAIFKKVAEADEYTSEVQLAAWTEHRRTFADATRGLRYGRKRAEVSDSYFKFLLESARTTKSK